MLPIKVGRCYRHRIGVGETKRINHGKGKGTLFRKRAYPPLILPSRPGFTPRFITPQNLPIAFGWFSPLDSRVDSSKSKCTDERPPPSASHPTAHWSMSVRELKV